MCKGPFTSSVCDTAARSLQNEMYEFCPVLLHQASASMLAYNLSVACKWLCNPFRTTSQWRGRRVAVAGCKWALTALKMVSFEKCDIFQRLKYYWFQVSQGYVLILNIFLRVIISFLQNRATNSLHNDTRVIIELIDKNDEIPQFVALDQNGRYDGRVAENLAPGAEVIQVTATDRDEFPEYNKVSKMIIFWIFKVHDTDCYISLEIQLRGRMVLNTNAVNWVYVWLLEMNSVFTIWVQGTVFPNCVQ